jgi:hypothetical protein
MPSRSASPSYPKQDPAIRDPEEVIPMLAFPITSVPLSELRDLLVPIEPTASVYQAPTGSHSGDPEWEPILRRRRIAQHLAEQGASNPTIDAILGHLARLPERTPGYAVFARDGRVVLAQYLSGAATNLAAYAAPAKVGPLLAWTRQQVADEPWNEVDIAGARLTVHALAEGRVRRLLIVDDPDDRRLGWFGADLLCTMEEDGRPPSAQRARLTDIAIRAAVLTGATVTVLTAAEGSRMPDGMAALVTQ